MMTEPEGDAAGESRSLARGGALSFAGAAGSALLGFALTIVLTRSFGQAGSGVVLQAIAVFTIALSIAKLGTDSVAIWMLPRLAHDEPARIRATLGQLFAIAVVGGLVAGALIVWLAPVIGTDPRVAAAIAATGWFLPVAAVLMVALASTRGLGGVGPYVALGSIGLPLLRILVVLAIAIIGGSLTMVALGWAAPVVLVAIAAVYVVWRGVSARERRAGIAGTFRPVPGSFSGIRRYAIPRTISAGLEQSLLWLDVVLVGVLAGPALAGIYGGASRFVAAGLIVDTALRVVVSPRFSSLLHQGRIPDVESLYRTAARWLVIFSTPIYLILGVFAPVVLSWLGPGFDEGAVALAILSAGAIVTFAAGNIHSVLLMSGHSGWAATNKAIVLALNIAGNLILVPLIGLTGAAISWSVSMLVDAALASIQVRRFVGIRIDLRGIAYALLVPAASIGIPAVAVRAWLGATPLALVVALLTGAILFVTWCLLDRRRLELTELLALFRRRGKAQ